MEKRISLLEQECFGADGPEHRFEKIEKESCELRTLAKQQEDDYNGKINMQSTRVDDLIFGLSSRLQKVEVFETSIATMQSRFGSLESNI